MKNKRKIERSRYEFLRTYQAKSYNKKKSFIISFDEV